MNTYAIIRERIENSIDASLSISRAETAPRRLSAALNYAVQPGGARVRPTILLSVAMACGDDKPAISDAAAAALELMHCASLVHDDLPCFDDADFRRGKPSVHRAFSEPLAVLSGDALIMAAFETLAGIATLDASRAASLCLTLARKSGMPDGICAGQGWESEENIDLGRYHRAKTGALFIAATQMGAIATGQDPKPWLELGDRIGEAFQLADDLCDTLVEAETMGKPSGQDERIGRPNAVARLGVEGAMAHLTEILANARDCIPSCPGEALLVEMMTTEVRRLMPNLAGYPDTGNQ